MEYENKYSSKAVGGTALGLAIGALGLETLRGGNLGGLLGGGGGCGCSEDHVVNRYELSQENEISRLRTEISLRDSNTYAMNQLNNFRNYVDSRFSGIEQQLCQQNVYNATNTAALGCLQGQVAQLMSLSKLIIPSENICPTPMPQYNSWTAPTTTT